MYGLQTCVFIVVFPSTVGVYFVALTIYVFALSCV